MGQTLGECTFQKVFVDGSRVNSLMKRFAWENLGYEETMYSALS